MRTVAGALAFVVAGASVPDGEYEKAFEKFEKDFNKQYLSKPVRDQAFENFKGTYDFIATENAMVGKKYVLGINGFSDETPDDFAKSHYGYARPKNAWGSAKNLGTHVYDGAPLADSVDWNAKGAVTKVKNQGQCGSCWSFSTTGGLEGAWEIATKKLVSLSEEMLVDCSTQNHGCGGGSMDLAFQYVEKNGLCTEKSYPYIAGGGQAGKCKASTCTKALQPGAVTGFHDVAHNEKALMSALMLGPVSIAVEADKSVFQSYKSGVMTGMCGTALDHGILAVGYGTRRWSRHSDHGTLEGATKFWMVKNSWGTVWGEAGFGKLERGKNSQGECGILTGATYPKVSGKPGPSPGPSPPAPPTLSAADTNTTEFYYFPFPSPNCCTQIPAAWVNMPDRNTPAKAFAEASGARCTTCCEPGGAGCPSADAQWIKGTCASAGKKPNRNGWCNDKDNAHCCTEWCNQGLTVV